ncbi:hypothetical protein BO82DRAFT_368308 [Aspergillus uvarum CBS 121591]|uniref:Uncharacterized protein n=1 Tax=Aspergillus uvarum CBS 121591 TaxID=1448315 RepID=A0A319BY98_9EURO|nr:hypothetical protein BO82DRAFT_368308 [Aspergillus uvarum CBS 121591]PYH77695.1 hypothetical protein BO82DRAFT_368308 [Aspergillus uvarum CBS 121591]
MSIDNRSILRTRKRNKCINLIPYERFTHTRRPDNPSPTTTTTNYHYHPVLYHFLFLRPPTHHHHPQSESITTSGPPSILSITCTSFPSSYQSQNPPMYQNILVWTMS